MKPLPRSFFNRDTVEVARALLGQHLVRRLDSGAELVCRITETEAYIGRCDKACHAYGYKRTPRTETLFASPGTAYLYLIYGMYPVSYTHLDVYKRQEEARAQSRQQLQEWRDSFQELLDKNAFGQRRLLKAFPKLRSTRHRTAMDRLRRRLDRK